MSVEAGGFAGRAPDRSVHAEQQFANVIEEMATAAGLPPPRVLITDSETVNAKVCGEDESSASILATTGLLATVGRVELQGVAGHLGGCSHGCRCCWRTPCCVEPARGSSA